MEEVKQRQSHFINLVNLLETDVFRYAFWLCGDREIAVDLVQETFTRAWKALHQLSDDKAAKNWLFTKELFRLTVSSSIAMRLSFLTTPSLIKVR